MLSLPINNKMEPHDMKYVSSKIIHHMMSVGVIALLALTTQACAKETPSSPRHENQNTTTTAAAQPISSQSPHLSGLPNFVPLIKKAAPAVVSITGVRAVSNGSPLANILPNLPPGSPFRQFFKHFFEQNPNTRGPRSKERILGSGFIISADGYIVTNRHVVVGDTDIKVRLLDRHEYKAKVIGMDKRTDLALLKISAKNLPTLPLGDSANLKVGQWVLAIGNPFGFDYSATQGIISALSRNLPNENYIPFIQTDAPVNPGNSGGPLLNMRDQVIGVNSQIYTNSGGFIGLSFAIPANIVKDVVAQLKTHGKVSYGWLGVMVQNMNQSLAQSFGLHQPEGALIAQVIPNSPAAKAGLKPGDIILEYNHHQISDSGNLPPLVGATPVGTRIPLVILRDHQHVTLMITIAPLKETSRNQSVRSNLTQQGGPLGILLQNLTHEQRSRLGIQQGGVLIKGVKPGGVAAKNGVEPGDVIIQFSGQLAQDSAQLSRLIRRAPVNQPIPVLILRNKMPLFITITIPKG